MVSTVHDLAIFDTPWAFPAAPGGRRAVAGPARPPPGRRRHRRLVVHRGADRQALLGLDATVVHSAPSPDMSPPSAATRWTGSVPHYGLPDRFVLHVGNIEPRKDIATLAGRLPQLRRSRWC